MENTSIAIYIVSANNNYAALADCSRGLNGHIPRSLKLDDNSLFMERIQQYSIWFNRDLVKGFPSYCAPVYHKEKLFALIMIWQSEVNQMTLHYRNLLGISASLMHEALIQAVAFNRERESTLYYPGTQIMMTRQFAEAYRANLVLVEMKKVQTDYLVIRRDNPGRKFREIPQPGPEAFSEYYDIPEEVLKIPEADDDLLEYNHLFETCSLFKACA